MPASRVPVDFLPAASLDLREAVAEYEKQRMGLGETFRSAVRHATNAIGMAPYRWPVRRGKHRYVMRRYPYTVVYLTDGVTVTIVAVAHQKRDPGSWENR